MRPSRRREETRREGVINNEKETSKNEKNVDREGEN
jgi:hypothetical protein